MKLQRPRGYRSASMRDDIEIRHVQQHWSFDQRAASRNQKVKRDLQRAVRTACVAILLEMI